MRSLQVCRLSVAMSAQESGRRSNEVRRVTTGSAMMIRKRSDRTMRTNLTFPLEVHIVYEFSTCRAFVEFVPITGVILNLRESCQL